MGTSSTGNNNLRVSLHPSHCGNPPRKARRGTATVVHLAEANVPRGKFQDHGQPRPLTVPCFRPITPEATQVIEKQPWRRRRCSQLPQLGDQGYKRLQPFPEWSSWFGEATHGRPPLCFGVCLNLSSPIFSCFPRLPRTGEGRPVSGISPGPS